MDLNNRKSWEELFEDQYLFGDNTIDEARNYAEANIKKSVPIVDSSKSVLNSKSSSSQEESKDTNQFVEEEQTLRTIEQRWHEFNKQVNDVEMKEIPICDAMKVGSLEAKVHNYKAPGQPVNA